MIEFVEGCLFSANRNYSLAQCISGDINVGMFRGISVQFLDIYPELAELRSLKVLNLGAVIPVKFDEKFIYNLVTKPCFWHKPEPYNILVSLKSMKIHAINNSVNDIAIPFLGSGCDKLDFFEDVLPLIQIIFRDSSINIHIYSHSKVSIPNLRLVKY